MGYPRDLTLLGAHVGYPDLSKMVSSLLYEIAHPEDPAPPDYLDMPDSFVTSVRVFPSATAVYYAPSDYSGLGGMHRERIRATPSWRSGPARYDCVFVQHDAAAQGMRGLHFAHVRLFFSFRHQGSVFPCALVQWFSVVGENPDELTGMWIVEPDFDTRGRRAAQVIHVDTIVRGAHLIGVAGEASIPSDLHFSDSLDAFRAFYVNKYADHHAHDLIFN